MAIKGLSLAKWSWNQINHEREAGECPSWIWRLGVGGFKPRGLSSETGAACTASIKTSVPSHLHETPRTSGIYQEIIVFPIFSLLCSPAFL